MGVRDLIGFIETTHGDVFIEAEAKPDRMTKFISDYNSNFSPKVDRFTDGICLLKPDANKWGLELRLYLRTTVGVPSKYKSMITKNDKYRGDFSYRLNNNAVINEMFEKGFRIGENYI